jgi:mannosyltransferase
MISKKEFDQNPDQRTLRMQNNYKTPFFSLPHIIFLFILCAGIFLRFNQIGYYDLWYDEAYSVMRATNIARYVARIDTYMQAPLYYVFLHLVIRIFGNSEVAIRIPSALANIFSIVVLYRIVKTHCSPKSALIAAFLCAFSPFQLWYSQEARVYSFAFCMSLVLLFVYLGMHRKEGRGLSDFFLLLTVSVVALCCHYFLIFVIVPIWLAFIVTLNKDTKIIFLYAMPAILIVSFPAYPIFIRQILVVKNSFWLTPPNFIDFIFTISNIIFGYTIPVYWSIAGFVLVMLIFIYWTIRAPKNSMYALILSCGICPIIILFFISQYVPVFLPRPMIVFTPFLLIMLAQSLSILRLKIVKALIGISVVLIFINGIHNFYTMQMPVDVKYHRGVLPKKQVQPIAHQLKEKVKDPYNTVLIHTVNNVFPPFLYYITDIYHIFLTVESEQTDMYSRKMHYYTSDSLMYPTHKNKVAYKYSDIYLKDLSQMKELHTLLQDYDSLWLVRSGWHRDGSSTPHSEAIYSGLQNNGWRLEQKDSLYYDGIYLDRFKRL